MRELRLCLRDSQQQIAAHMGPAISTVVRYELSRPPKRNGLRRVRRVGGARCARAQWRQVQFTEGAAAADHGGLPTTPPRFPQRDIWGLTWFSLQPVPRSTDAPLHPQRRVWRR